MVSMGKKKIKSEHFLVFRLFLCTFASNYLTSAPSNAQNMT